MELIEKAIESNPLVTNCFVHGEADKSAPVCFLNVDSTALSQKMGIDVKANF